MTSLSRNISPAALCAAMSDPVDTNRMIVVAKRADTIPEPVWRDAGFLSKRLAVLSGYTAEFISDRIKARSLRYKIRAHLHLGAFNAFEQAIYGRDSSLIAFAPDVIADGVEVWRFQVSAAPLLGPVAMRGIYRPAAEIAHVQQL